LIRQHRAQRGDEPPVELRRRKHHALAWHGRRLYRRLLGAIAELALNEWPKPRLLGHRELRRRVAPPPPLHHLSHPSRAPRARLTQRRLAHNAQTAAAYTPREHSAPRM